MLYYAQKLSGAGGQEQPSRFGDTQQAGPAMQEDTTSLHWGEEEDGEQAGPRMEDDGQAVAAHAATTVQPTLADILQAVNKCTASVDTIKEQFGLLRQDMQKIRERTTAVESRVSEVEDQMHPMAQDTRAALQMARDAYDRVEDMENRLRRNNVRIVGLPERVEGKDPTTFVESWLLELFGKNALSPFFAVERAHRVPSRPPQQGGPPRSILAKLLHYRDREAVLRQARERANIQHNGVRVSFYPDFSQEVQRRRAKFTDVKRRLRNLQLPYAMLYPAKLRVVVRGQAQFFESAKEAMTWLDRNEQSLQRRAQEGGE